MCGPLDAWVQHMNRRVVVNSETVVGWLVTRYNEYIPTPVNSPPFSCEMFGDLMNLLGGYLAFIEVSTVSMRQFTETISIRTHLINGYIQSCNFRVRSARVRMELAAWDADNLRRARQPVTPPSETDEFAWEYGPEQEEM